MRIYPLNNIQSFLWHVHTEPTIKKISLLSTRMTACLSFPFDALQFSSLNILWTANENIETSCGCENMKTFSEPSMSFK